METINLHKHVQNLATLQETSSSVLSAYLDLQQGIEKCLIFLEERRRLVERGLVQSARHDLNQVVSKVKSCLKSEVDTSTKGMAIFVRNGTPTFSLPLQFRLPLPNRFVYAPAPYIYPLIELKDKYHRYVILIATKRSARILEVNLGAVTESLWTKRPELRQRIGRAWTKEHFQTHRHNRTDKFFNEKIEILQKLMAGGGYTHLVIAGNSTITSQIQKLLPKHLLPQLIDIIPASNKIKTESVVEKTLASFIQREQEESFQAVERLKAELFGDGLAIVGDEDCIDALEDGQADMLLLAAEYKNQEKKEKMVRLAIQSGCDIETVSDSYTLIQHGGVGCLLRYLKPRQHASLANIA